MLTCLTSFLWRAGLLGIVLAGSRGAAKDVRSGFAKAILLFTQAFAFWTTVLLTVCYVDSTLGSRIAPCSIEQLKRALTPALCTLAIVGFFVAAWVWLFALRPAAVANGPDEKPKRNGKDAWEEFRTMWTGWYKRCQRSGYANSRILRAWASTLALCAGVCLMSICVEAEAEQDYRPQQAGPRHSRCEFRHLAVGCARRSPQHSISANENGEIQATVEICPSVPPALRVVAGPSLALRAGVWP
jgi:hypothetical protein